MTPHVSSSDRSQKRDLILVERELVRRCLVVLSRLKEWDSQKCSATVSLIYRLNSIADRYPLTRYRAGFPNPSQTIRALDGLRNVCRSAIRTGNSERAIARLSDLKGEDADAYHLLRFRYGRMLCPSNPEAALTEPDLDSRFLDFARSNLNTIAAFCDDAISAVLPLKAEGKGGRRRLPAPDARYVIEQLGLYFEELTEKPPGATIDLYASDMEAKYGGPFLDLCREVLDYFERPLKPQRIHELLLSIDNPRWKTYRRRHPTRFIP